MKKNIYIYLSILFTVALSCKKLVNIPPPTNSITTSQVFSTSEQAKSAASGMYYQMINSFQGIYNSAMTLCGGLSADELLIFDQNQTSFVQFQKNSLIFTNPVVSGNIWNNAYSTIYIANAVIEGLNTFSGVQDSIKIQLAGQAKFIRAFSNFYLVNLFGPVPNVNTINYHKTSLLSRSPISDIYTSIVSDLQDAQSSLVPDYSWNSSFQRIVPNKWAATALLSRVYLYLGQWSKADSLSTSIINNTNLFDLEPDLNNVFLTQSKEAIWQLQQDNNGSSFNATPEGYIFTPLDAVSHPLYYMTPALLNAFDSGDLRKKNWVDSTSYEGITYYYPYKYKIGPAQATAGGPYIEYYMVLRLAEQYLIRAEARAQMENLDGAKSDIDKIRNRAGLNDINATSKVDILDLIVHERQIEFFAEWGHRWIDLKRWNNAISVLSQTKGYTVTTNDLLFPIPNSELQSDPNLSQNPGY